MRDSELFVSCPRCGTLVDVTQAVWFVQGQVCCSEECARAKASGS